MDKTGPTQYSYGGLKIFQEWQFASVIETKLRSSNHPSYEDLKSMTREVIKLTFPDVISKDTWIRTGKKILASKLDRKFWHGIVDLFLIKYQRPEGVEDVKFKVFECLFKHRNNALKM